MRQFQCESGAEVIGMVVMGFINAFPDFARKQGLKILERHGVKDVKPDGWYSFQALLDAMKEIQDNMGAGFLARMGEQITLGIELPPDWKTLDVVLSGMDAGYQMQHRGGDTGHYTFGGMECSGGLIRAKVLCSAPAGCSFNRGIIEGLAKLFRPAGVVDVLVRHDETAPCMKNGEDSCTFVITWA